MDAKRKNFASQLSDEKKNNERMIKTLEKSIENIQSSISAGKDIAFLENRIKKSRSSIANYMSKNETINAKLNIVFSGGCDAEILQIEKEIEKELKEKDEKTAKKEAAAALRAERDKVVSKRYDKLERDEMRREWNCTRDSNKMYDKYWDIVASVPDYISKNIMNMPNNKGYKFRGVYFYGALAPEANAPVVIFEKKGDGIFITETYEKDEYVYFKSRDGQKQLLHHFAIERKWNAPMTRIRL